MSGTLHFVNALGHLLDVAIDGEFDALTVARLYGEHGWAPTSLPAGGIHLPYAMADTFDWSLIGARKFTMKGDGEEVVAVEHLGNVYTRRVFPANAKKKMPAAIKYSRGASATDPASIVEPVDGEVGKGYVTLAIFKGNGPVVEGFQRGELAQRSKARQDAPPPSAGRPVQANPPGDTTDQDLRGHRGRAEADDFDPLSALTAGQRMMIGKKAAEAGFDTESEAWRTLSRGITRTLMESAETPLDAQHIPAFLAKLKEHALRKSA